MTTTFAQPQTFVPSAAWQQTPWNLFGGYQSVGVKQQGIETPANPTTPIFNNNPYGTPSYGNVPFSGVPFGGVPFGGVPINGVPFGAIPSGSVPQFYQSLAGLPTGLGSCFGGCNALGQTSPFSLGNNGFALTPGFGTPAFSPVSNAWNGLGATTNPAFNPAFNPSLALGTGWNPVNSLHPFSSPIGAFNPHLAGTPTFGNFLNAQAFQANLGGTPFAYGPSIPSFGTPSPLTQGYNWSNPPFANPFGLLNAGVPLGSTAFSQVPFSGIPFSGIPFNHSPLSAVPFAGSPFNTIPSSTIPFNTAPFSASIFNTIPSNFSAFNTTPYANFPLSGQFNPYAGIPSTFGTPSTLNGTFGVNPWSPAFASSPIGAWNAASCSPLLLNTLNPYANPYTSGFVNGTSPIPSFVPGFVPTYANGFVNPMQGFVPVQANTQIDNGKMGGLNLNSQAA